MKIKVMVVDDEPAVLDILKTMLLETKGYEVEAVTDSLEAARRLCEEKVDGLLVDVRMPHLDGFGLTQAARESKLNRQVPIAMLTALDDAETMRKGFAAGISFFLGKPFTRERVYNLFKATRGPMLREKLRYVRVPYRTTVECRGTSGNQGHFKCGSQDISEGGMLLGPSVGREVGTHLEMRFPLPNTGTPLRVEAQIVRSVPPNSMGVMFENLAPRDKEDIQEYIKTCVQD